LQSELKTVKKICRAIKKENKKPIYPKNPKISNIKKSKRKTKNQKKKYDN